MHSGNASITIGMATVTIDGLACGVTYNILAAGMLNGVLVGPRSSHGTITAGPCSQLAPTNSTSPIIVSTGKEGIHTYV